MIANDFQYHKLCLTQFLNMRVLESSTDANTDHIVLPSRVDYSGCSRRNVVVGRKKLGH
jgi:hypothetical protein